MADPGSFFSTMAQAFGSIVSFIVGISVALYTIERQRVERRTEEYRENLIELKERYERVLSLLHTAVLAEGGQVPEGAEDLSLSNDEVEELINNEGVQKPQSSLLLTHITRVREALNRVEPENDYLLTNSEMSSLEDSSYWLYNNYNIVTSTGEEFIEEVVDGHYSESDNIADIGLFLDNINTARIEHRLRDIADERDEKVLDLEEADWVEDDIPRVTGSNFRTIAVLVKWLSKDVLRVEKSSSGTVIEYESGIRPIALLSTYLIIIGVVLPTGFLFTIPSSLISFTFPPLTLLVIQVCMLLASLAIVLALIETILRSTKPLSNISEEEELSFFTKSVIELLPSPSLK